MARKKARMRKDGLIDWGSITPFNPHVPFQPGDKIALSDFYLTEEIDPKPRRYNGWRLIRQEPKIRKVNELIRASRYDPILRVFKLAETYSSGGVSGCDQADSRRHIRNAIKRMRKDYSERFGKRNIIYLDCPYYYHKTSFWRNDPPDGRRHCETRTGVHLFAAVIQPSWPNQV